MVSLPRTCQHCGATLMHYGRCRCLPGTLTVTIGNRGVTLDPIDPKEKFYADKAKVTEMLIEIELAQIDHKPPQR